MSLPYSAVLIDLDGTILDSAPGITATLAFTFEKLGRAVPSHSELLAYVGPPILDSFRDLAGMTPIEGLHALSVYRERYLAAGIYDATIYDGMAGLLADIHASTIALSLATSKPEYPSTLMLKHFGVDTYFDLIAGSSEDESRSAKSDVIADALRRLALSGHDISKPVMIGDRGSDVHGAALNSVPAIFVEWGYGAVAEHIGSFATAATPEALRRLLLGPAGRSATTWSQSP